MVFALMANCKLTSFPLSTHCIQREIEVNNYQDWVKDRAWYFRQGGDLLNIWPHIPCQFSEKLILQAKNSILVPNRRKEEDTKHT
jgi:hypothetical protein